MATKLNQRGKVVKQHKGYNIRKMVEKKQTEKWQGNVGTLIKDKGTYGLYAGKNLIKDGFKNPEEAVNYVEIDLHKK